MANRSLEKLLVIAFSLMTISTTTHGERNSPPQLTTARSAMPSDIQSNTILKIRLSVEGKTSIAILADNATARDFVSLLPIELTLKDYASTEKISYLPRKLANDKSSKGFTPLAGDIAYYAPWGNLAVFYKGFEYSEGLIKLGTINSGIEALIAPESAKVLIEAIVE